MNSLSFRRNILNIEITQSLRDGLTNIPSVPVTQMLQATHESQVQIVTLCLAN